jgi:hypothetical protein
VTTSNRNRALSDIANDALTLRRDFRKSARRCHKAARAGSRDYLDDELREYVGIAQNLFVAVAVHLEEVASSLTYLSRDCTRLTAERFSRWDEVESELAKIEIAAISAISNEPSESIERLPQSKAQLDHHVTLKQLAGIVQKDKKTIQRLVSANKLPAPDVRGGNGKANEWIWSKVRGPLGAEFNRPLPEIFPADQWTGR